MFSGSLLTGCSQRWWEETSATAVKWRKGPAKRKRRAQIQRKILGINALNASVSWEQKEIWREGLCHAQQDSHEWPKRRLSLDMDSLKREKEHSTLMDEPLKRPTHTVSNEVYTWLAVGDDDFFSENLCDLEFFSRKDIDSILPCVSNPCHQVVRRKEGRHRRSKTRHHLHLNIWFWWCTYTTFFDSLLWQFSWHQQWTSCCVGAKVNVKKRTSLSPSSSEECFPSHPPVILVLKRAIETVGRL